VRVSTQPTTFGRRLGRRIRSFFVRDSPESVLDSALCKEQCIPGATPRRPGTITDVVLPGDSFFSSPTNAPESPVNTLVQGVQMTNPTRGVGPISSPHGVPREIRDGKVHKGIDIAMPIGTPIYAAHSGRVKTAQFSTSAGNFIEIVSDENNQVTTRYLHLSSFDVRAEATVTRGQLIGRSGNTGSSTGPHLHFDIRIGSPTANSINLPDISPNALFTQNQENPRSAPPAPSSTYADTSECEPCRQAQREQEQTRQEDATRAAVGERAERALRRFNNLKTILKYQEIMPDIMVSRIARASDGKESNSFGAAPGALSIKANMKMPGIAGLRIGELFWIDRMPLFYRAFGAFQTMTIEDEISISGWSTNITARFNYLGTAWKQSVVNQIRAST
jgi:hypothetical protein